MERIYYEDELSEVPKEAEEEAFRIEGAAPPELKRPFLEREDLEGGPQKEMVILEWLNFLLSRNDIEGLIDVLSYYVDMGWISDEVRSRMITYARSFFDALEGGSFSEIRVGEKRYRIDQGEVAPEEGAPGPDVSYRQGMDLRSHMRSLAYIMELAGEKFGEEIYKEVMERAGFSTNSLGSEEEAD